MLLWERKVGLVSLEKAGGNRFELILGVDRLLDERASELPAAYESQHAKNCDNQRITIALPKHDRPFVRWDSDELMEPLLDEAQQQATQLGHNYIGSEHLVLTIVKLADPRLSALLRDCGVTYHQVRNAVIRLFEPET